MSQVSRRATRLLLETCAARGLDTRPILAGLPLTHAELCDVRHRVDWDIFAEMNDRVAALIGGPEQLEAFGRVMVTVPSYRFFRIAANYVLSVRDLHQIGARWFAPAVFPDLLLRYTELNEQRIKVRAEIPSNLRGCATFLHIARGTLEDLSTLFELPRSKSFGTISKHVADLDLVLPSEKRTLRTLIRRARASIAGKPLVNELIQHQDRVNESYQEVLESRQELRFVLERLPFAAAIHRDGRYIWVNTALVRLLGWDDADQFTGRSMLEDTHPEDRVELAKRMATAAGGTSSGEFRVIRRDGTVAIFEFAPTQMVQFEGQSARLLVAGDVTERNRARDQLAIADRMQSLGMLAAGVAHEINNPLTYVQLSIETLAREAKSTSSIAASATALEGIERVRGIVGDLRTFARPDDAAIGSVDLNEVVESTLRLAGKTIVQSAELQLSLGTVPSVKANRARLGQVVMNLVLNAHEAVEERGGGVVRVVTAMDGDRVRLEVADSGVGIAARDLSRVFEPFFTTKPVGRGTGLGLAICHRIVTGFGGTIAVESTRTATRDRTLRTFVRVSLSPGDAVVEEPVARAAAPGRRRVLVVDDEPAVGRAIATALGAQHDVEVVDGGRAALARLQAEASFDLVLCDVMMPELDGIGLYEAIEKTLPSLARRFVFMSGGAFTPRARAFLSRCANSRLEKPFRIDQVLALIDDGG